MGRLGLEHEPQRSQADVWQPHPLHDRADNIVCVRARANTHTHSTAIPLQALTGP
jgi:hypothetical protein